MHLTADFCFSTHINYKCEKIRKKIKRRNLDGNKKNIGKRTKQKRRPGGTSEGSAKEKTEQGIAGQAEPGCGRAGEDDGESGGEIKKKINETQMSSLVKIKIFLQEIFYRNLFRECDTAT